MNLVMDICKTIGEFRLESHFTLEAEKCGVFGPSGSGKSTLMHVLAGLTRPDRGQILIDGDVLFDGAQGVNLSPQERRIGVVFQHSHLFPHLNVKKNLLFGWQRLKPELRRGSPEELIEPLGLGELLNRDVTTLSGGERQRVALGRTMLACPRLIILDEPLTGLDRELKYQIIPYLRDVLGKSGIPMLFISHSLEEIRLLTDRVLVFSEGEEKIVEIPAEDLARRYMVSRGRGYANHLNLSSPKALGDLWCYSWQGGELILTEPGRDGETIFELGAKDITLFKEHPVATSARNMLHCEVADVFGDGNRLGVELVCPHGGRLISQIVPDAARELDICKGRKLVAVIKASAFRKLY